MPRSAGGQVSCSSTVAPRLTAVGSWIWLQREWKDGAIHGCLSLPGRTGWAFFRIPSENARLGWRRDVLHKTRLNKRRLIVGRLLTAQWGRTCMCVAGKPRCRTCTRRRRRRRGRSVYRRASLIINNQRLIMEWNGRYPLGASPRNVILQTGTAMG